MTVYLPKVIAYHNQFIYRFHHVTDYYTTVHKPEFAGLFVRI